MKKSVVVKYALFSLVVMFVFITGVSNSFAGQGDRSVDVTAGFGTGPEDFDNGFGFGLGLTCWMPGRNTSRLHHEIRYQGDVWCYQLP